jgi:hypothetical protein
MLHIATVHYVNPRWIEVQTRHLRDNISVPYMTWASLEGIDASYHAYFDRVFDLAWGHSAKLNNLALEISAEADEDDLIMFLDGDAFPIRDPMPLIDESLRKAPLVAVKRAENGGDEQPHPCFCVTSVKTWHEIHGDWSPGYKWLATDGKRMTDTGGTMLRALELANTPWVPILRTNKSRMDPLFFAIYGDTVYHHGAGFRRGGASRGFYDRKPKPMRKPRSLLMRPVAARVDRVRKFVWRATHRAPQIAESKRVFEKIQRGDPDWVAYVSP